MSSEMPKGSEKKIQYSISMAPTEISISLNLNPMVKALAVKTMCLTSNSCKLYEENCNINTAK